MFVAAVEHGSGVVRGQVGSDSAGGEILGVRRLLREIGVAGRVVTADALHGCPNTARQIVDGGGDYVMPIKANRKALLDDVRILDWNAAPCRATTDKGHGRIETRTCAVVPLGPDHEHVADLPGRRQAFRIVRRRTEVKSGRTSEETVLGLSSLPPERAGPVPRSSPSTAATGRSRTASTTSATSPSTRTRSRIRAGKLPRNLACLSNAAIAVVRMRGRFKHQPQAHRHYAATQADALRDVLAPAF